MQTMTRRQILEMAVTAAGLCTAPLCARSVLAAASQSQFQGCFLRAGSDDFLDKLNLLLSSGDKEVDQVCAAAEGDLRREFKISPDTWFFDDKDGPNAFATWLLRRGFKGDGTVCLGTRLVRQITRRNELNRQWKTRLTAVMAHEWSHIVQFSRGYRGAGKAVELHADFLAGWFLGRTRGARDFPTDKQRTEAGYRIFLYGDGNIHSPDHHGTGAERVSAIQSGFELAAKVYNVDDAFRARNVKG